MRVRDVLRGTDTAEAEEALLMVLGEERVREIVRDELDRRTDDDQSAPCSASLTSSAMISAAG